MTGYIRQDVSNNISNGSVIDADDLDAEFDALATAFNASTGHTHDGTSAEGAPITVVGPAQDVSVTSGAVLPKTTNVYDLGSSPLKWKDLHIQGNIFVSGNVDGRDVSVDGTKLDGIEVGAEVNQNAFATVAVSGQSSVVADAKTDTLTFSAGTGISLTTNASTDTVTFTNSAPDQTVVLTAGSNVTITGSYPNFTIASANTSYTASTGLTLTGTAFSIDSTVATLTGTQTLTNKTLVAATLNDGYTEEVFAVTGTTPALSPTNGSIQTWTLSGNSTPTAGTWASGQSLSLLVNDGTSRTITWTSLPVVWKTDLGTAPTLNTSGETVIQLWKVGTTIYGARVGDA